MPESIWREGRLLGFDRVEWLTWIAAIGILTLLIVV